MRRRRVAVTGIGLVTAVGATREDSWNGLIAGASGIGAVSLFDTEGYRSRIAGEVDLAAATGGRLSRYERRRLARGDQLGIVAADEALADAGLPADVNPRRVGVLLGAGTADLLRNERYFETALAAGFDKARPLDAWSHFPNTLVDLIAARHGFEGPRATIVAACSSGTIAIGQAADAIRAGTLDAAVAGGADALSRLTYSGFNALRLMDPAPCRPFDPSRAGMNIGEGAGMLVLEDLESAVGRGARIHAELAGYSALCEAFHPTAPEPEGHAIVRLLAAALADAGVDAAAVDHINAHGTATPQNDRAEARGFRAALGSRTPRVPVTSIKASTGHCLGAAGAVEAAVTVLTVARGVIPPTVHHGETDPECGIDVVANAAREAAVACAVSTSLAFGGNDAALVLTRPSREWRR